MRLERIDRSSLEGGGPVRHENFPPALQARIEATYRELGKYVNDSLEHWELNFMRDMRPEREIRLWEIMGAAMKAYIDKYQDGKRPPHGRMKQLVGTLCCISMGATFDYSPKIKRRLLSCYKAAGGKVAPLVVVQLS